MRSMVEGAPRRLPEMCESDGPCGGGDDAMVAASGA